MLSPSSNEHISVLLDEVVNFAPKETNTIIDFTLGRAGHSSSLLESKNPKILYGIDRDKEAILFSEEKLSSFKSEVRLIQNSFSEAIKILNADNIKVDYILADLGISSPQVDNDERGFSFRKEARLDMRMDREQTFSAYELVNQYSKKELAYIIRMYGEDKFAQRIAGFIVQQREVKPIETTTELAEIIFSAIPRKLHKKIHPATQTFQAIRIEVNSELEQIHILMQNCLNLLKPQGRLAVISFHSLEDRIIKKYINEWLNPCKCPPQMPHCICGKKPLIKKLHGKVITPTKNEIERNARARSSKLRVIEKL